MEKFHVHCTIYISTTSLDQTNHRITILRLSCVPQDRAKSLLLSSQLESLYRPLMQSSKQTLDGNHFNRSGNLQPYRINLPPPLDSAQETSRAAHVSSLAKPSDAVSSPARFILYSYYYIYEHLASPRAAARKQQKASSLAQSSPSYKTLSAPLCSTRRNNNNDG